MAFDRKTLEACAKGGQPIGRYNGRLVYSCTKEAFFDRADKSCYYVLYDADNWLCLGSAPEAFGRLGISGDVEEFARPIMFFREPVKEELKVEASAKEIPLVSMGRDNDMFFAELDAEIDRVLKNAAKDLGLEEFVAKIKGES